MLNEMTQAIATQLQAIIDSNTKLLELHQSDPDWQTKIASAMTIPESPVYLIFPETVADLGQIVAQAAQHQWRILICGNGSKLNWGKVATNIQLVISTQKCDRLIEHAVNDLTVTVESGMKLAELQAQLRSANQFLPIDPAYPDTATVGGIVATADTGSWREGYGGVRDLLLGLSFIRGDGAIAKAGGRVVKNVAGYDLMKLFTGAYGSLGIITQVTFRTYPLISTSQTLLLTGQGEAIAKVNQGIRNSGLTPTALDLLSTGVVGQLNLGDHLGLIARWQTIPASITQQISQVKAIASELNLTATDYQEQEEIDLWQQCATLTSMVKEPGELAIVCKLGIAPSAAVNFLQLKSLRDLSVAVRIHASSGIGQLQFNHQDLPILRQIRAYCQQHQGFMTLLDAPQSIKQQIDVWGYTGNGISTMKAIKQQFDPQNIFNSDRFLV